MKAKAVMVDGLNDADVKKLRAAIRQVWRWSYSRKLVEKRCALGGGYSRCEMCRKKCPKIFVDHIVAIGPFDPATFIFRMFIPSTQLQGLCHVCHKIKTKADTAVIKKRRIIKDFF
jgi:hypothetical protein